MHNVLQQWGHVAHSNHMPGHYNRYRCVHWVLHEEWQQLHDAGSVLWDDLYNVRQHRSATRYYSRDRTLVEVVAVYVAVGLSMTSVLGGSTMTSALGRVIAARNVGQCWGPAGSSMFSLPVDVCGGSENKDETQLEAHGDAVVSVGLTSFGIVGLLVYHALYGIPLRFYAQDQPAWLPCRSY